MKRKNIFFIAKSLPINLKSYSHEHQITQLDNRNPHSSLMDADILIIDPYVFLFKDKSGGYGINSSFQEGIVNQIEEYLKKCKNIFILFKKNHPRLYNFIRLQLPFDPYLINNFHGEKINDCKDLIFKEFFDKFSDSLSYDAYIKNENLKNCKTIFTGNHQENILGFRFERGGGNIIFLPLINVSSLTQLVIDKEGSDLEQAFKKVSSSFYKEIVEIDKKLSLQKKKSSPPLWIDDNKYLLKREKEISEKVNENKKEIIVIRDKIDELEKEKNDLIIIKDLLFETGPNLEIAVNKALKIIGYEVVAENHIDDKNFEYDQILKSPEGIYYVGECEGKETKAINFEKSSKLASKKNRFIEEMTKKDDQIDCYGILFGNPFREISPENRTNDFFTSHCLVNAKSSNIILVKTLDLFYIAKYLCENNDEQFKKECRDKIFNSLGKVVEFPNIPIV